MNLSLIMGIVAIFFMPLIGIGLALENATYWIILDSLMLIYFPWLGLRLIQESRKTH